MATEFSFKNNLKAELYENMTDSQTTIKLKHLVNSSDPAVRLAAWPRLDSVSQSHPVSFFLTLEDKISGECEIIICTGIYANTDDYIQFVCARGMDGTTAAAHPIDATMVENREVSAFLNNLSNIYWTIASGDIFNSVVSLATNQTISGNKTFTSNPVIQANTPMVVLHQTDITKGTNPSATQHGLIIMSDSAGTATVNRTGCLANSISSAGLTSTTLYAYQFVNGSTASATLGVYCSADGTQKYATAPTPTAGDNSTKIATTEWVNNQISENISSILFQKIFQSSGRFSDTVDRHVRMTIVAGGGSGGNGGTDVYGGSNTGGLGGRKGGNSNVTIPAGATLDGVLLTSSRTLTVTGGAAGNGGGRYSGGGGGEAGNFEERELILPAGLELTFAIGAGGEPYTSGTMSGETGGIGEGNPCQTGAPNSWGGAGAYGAGDGQSYTTGWALRNNTAYGGTKHPRFGGGGPGGPKNGGSNSNTTLYPIQGGRPGPGAGEANIIMERSAATYSRGGRGGDGALILEYWNSFAA